MIDTADAILEIGALLLVAAAAGWLARRLGLPAIVGYLVVGLAVSPFTPGFVADRAQLQLLADVGVVLLLFEVGIEIDLRRLRQEHAGIAWAAPAQAVATTLLAGWALILLGLPPLSSAVLGLAIALSSSVVIVNITRSRRRTTDPATERALLGWSVLQDVTGVAIAVVLLAGVNPAARPPLVVAAGVAGYALVAILVAGALLPRVLRQLRDEHDLFLIVSVAAGLAVAGVGAVLFGIPLALAAFVAGLVITDTAEATEARRRLLPFRDLFAVLFFVAIGTLVDPGALATGIGWLAVFLVLVVVAKVLVAYLLARVARLDARPLQLAVGLGQVGEFAFVLGAALLAASAIEAPVFVALMATIAVSIATSTILVRVVGPSPLPDPTPSAP